MDLGDFKDAHVGIPKKYCDVGLARLISPLMILSCRPLGSNEPLESIAGISILDMEARKPEHPPFSRVGVDGVRLVELQPLLTAP